MRMGKPIITLSSPATRGLFKDGEHMLLVKPGSGKALAQAILRLKKDPELRKRLAENARRLYGERFSTKRLGEKVKDVLESMLERRGR
jgi:glycosyltransferase involved in cell wall biosynthesis